MRDLFSEGWSFGHPSAGWGGPSTSSNQLGGGGLSTTPFASARANSGGRLVDACVQYMLVESCGCFGPVASVQLAQDVLHMLLDRALRERQVLCNLPVAGPLRNQYQHLRFPRREP